MRSHAKVLVAVAALFSSLALVPAVSAAKYVDSFFGNPDAQGGVAGGLFGDGDFPGPGGVAVNDSTGAVYVVDPNNHRIQQFDAANAFVRAWGQDVIGGNERQTVVVNATAGQYKLKFAGQTTANIAFNATGSTLQSALRALPAIGSSGVTVSFSTSGSTRTYTVTFTGSLAATDVEQLTSEPGTTPLSGGTGVSIATVANGFGGVANTGFELCTVAVECKNGLTASTAGAFNAPKGIAVNQSTGHLYVTDGSNLRVQEFDASGGFVRTWGQDVVKAGAPNDISTSAFEICDTTAGNNANDCKAGASGTQGGAFASTFTGFPAVVPAGAPNAGNVLVADPGNRRVQEFTATGAFVRAFGFDVVQPGGAGEVLGPLLNERQRVTLSSFFGPIIAGTFKLKFDGQETAAIKYNASSIEVENALVALSNLGPGDVSVTGPQKGPWEIDFTGGLAGTNVPPMTADASQLDAGFGAGLGTEANVATPQEGGPGPAYEVCTVTSQCKIGVAGDGLGQFGADQPKQVVADAAGAVYAVEANPSSPANARVQKFSGLSLSPTLFGNEILGGKFGSEVPAGLAFDSIGQKILVTAVRTLPPGTCAESIPQVLIFEFTTTGVLQETHGSCTKINSGAANGLATRASNGRFYLASFGLSTGASLRRVWLFDDDGFGPATVELDPPSEVTAHTASVSGTVTPNGPPTIPTGYRFQYSRNGVTWTDANSEVKIGDGSSPVAIGPLTITGLEGGTFYRVRLITNKGFGNLEDVSPELTFATDGIAPEVQTRYPQSHTDATARLAGEINPNNLLSTYHFEYGKTTAYGSFAPVPHGSASGGTAQYVTAEVDGLQPGTTYHYRLVATNAEGTTEGQDVTFKTYAAGASAKPQRAFEMMTPPFKVVRAITNFGGTVGNNPNPGIPSLDGNAMLWTTSIFPLTDDVRAPAGGDRRYLERTADGWTFDTQNTLPGKLQSAGVIDPGAGTVLTKIYAKASSGDLRTVATATENMTLLPSEGWGNIFPYTFRKGVGIAGYTPWLTNPDTQASPGSITSVREDAKLNDVGTVMMRWGGYFNLAEDPSTPWDDDPTGEQSRGTNAYLVRAATPEELPTAPKEVVAECTGTGAGATEIPNRVGTGSSPTDTIGVRTCEEAATTPAATGIGTRTTGSNTLTGVTTSTGTFSVGQVISGAGISGLATITAVGAGTITISIPVECGGAKADNVTTTAGSPVIVARPVCGAFEVGQAVTGPGIPPGTTILSVDGYELTLSASATESKYSPDGPVVATVPSPTALTANAQHVTSREGAMGGGANETAIGTVSNDGSRAFFMSPAGELDAVCSNGTGVNTSCPAQLFVRQYDSDGNPTVRWISRAQGVGTQQIGLIGHGANFEGASRDGRHVFFKTNAPLLPTDPNAGSSTTTGTAQDKSWDLYRYTLPESPDEDPADGTLLRITGGPSGTADPSTNTNQGGALRYFSDDGKRAYFVTTAEIPGAVNGPPSGGSTNPGGAVGNNATRNLYLFDDTLASPKWRFIARIPFSTVISGATPGGTNDPNSLNACASMFGRLGSGHLENQGVAARLPLSTNCFRGTPDGSNVIFFTRGQLTPDDRDDAGDIYLYDANADELTRVSAPQNPSAQPYSCNLGFDGKGNGLCNADLGLESVGGAGFSSGAGSFDSARGWGGSRHYNVGQDANGTIRVFFESESKLVPEDTNGSHMDVYEWSNGRLSLVSPGTGDSYSFFSGNSVSGRDVFLFTSARIDPREIDDADYDLYDVRIGGGFPYTPPPTPCDVLAHECRPDALPEAAPRPAISSTFSGEGNLKATKPRSGKCAKGKVRRKGRCIQKQSKAKKQKKRASKQNGRAGR